MKKILAKLLLILTLTTSCVTAPVDKVKYEPPIRPRMNLVFKLENDSYLIQFPDGETIEVSFDVVMYFNKYNEDIKLYEEKVNEIIGYYNK